MAGRIVTIECIEFKEFMNDTPASVKHPGGLKISVPSQLRVELHADSARRVFGDSVSLYQGGRWEPDGLTVACVSSVELVLIEEDRGSEDPGMDDNTDEVLVPVDLVTPPRDGPLCAEVSRTQLSPDGLSLRRTLRLAHQARGGELLVTYTVEPHDAFEHTLVATARTQARPHLNTTNAFPRGTLAADKGRCRWICSLDGGGMRGIFALRALEQLEQYYGVPCNEIFDMYACTSTGSLIGAALARGTPLSEIIALYGSAAVRARIWRKANQQEDNALYSLPLFVGPVAGYKASSGTIREWLDWYDYDFSITDEPERALRRALPALAGQLCAPRYRKDGIVAILNTIFSDPVAGGGRRFLKLSDLKKDILITAYDTFRHRTVCFTAFRPWSAAVGPAPLPIIPSGAGPLGVALPAAPAAHGRYAECLVRDVVECSMSATPYFAPRGRFVDGGIGAYNNPVYLAAYAALYDSAPPGPPMLSTAIGGPLYPPYRETATDREGTVVWSFGTGTVRPDIDQSPASAVRPTFANAGSTLAAGANGKYTPDLDRAIFATFWIERLIESFMTSSSEQQTEVVRRVMHDQVRLVRCNLEASEALLDEWGMPELKASLKFAPSNIEYEGMDEVAKRYADSLRLNRFGFDVGGLLVRATVSSNTEDLYALEVAQALVKD